jgi:succinoglycan biosynthesis transport protein ExoP
VGAPERTDNPQPGALQTPAARLSMYAATLRRRWRLALCIVAVAVLAGVVVATFAPKSYDATAKVLIGQRAQVDALLGATDYTPDPERDVNTSLELITLEPVAKSVRRRLGLDISDAMLIGKVETGMDRNSNVVSITAHDRSPRQAARIANAFAVAYRDFRARSARASIGDAIASAERRAALLAPGPERDALEAELRQLQAVAAFQTGGVQLVRRATAASALASGGLLPSALVAGFLGVLLAGVAVVFLARTDKRVRGADDLEAILGRPVLATVPNPLGRNGGVQASDALATLALSLALRDLRSREAAAGSRNGSSARVLLLTSPGRDEGTTEVALGLAQALSDTGRRVILIEADLRDPSLAALLGLEHRAGLVAILAGARTLDQELVELGDSGGGPAGARVVPAGARSLLPQPLLAGGLMAALVAEARRRADVVLLAGAPASVFGDAFALVPLADAALLVARFDVTRRDEALRVAGALEDLDCPLVGSVATTGASGVRTAIGLGGVGRRRSHLEWLYETDPAGATANGSVAPSTTTPEVTVR